MGDHYTILLLLCWSNDFRIQIPVLYFRLSNLKNIVKHTYIRVITLITVMVHFVCPFDSETEVPLTFISAGVQGCFWRT